MYANFFYVFPSRYEEAVASIEDIAKRQRDIIRDPNVADLFETLQLLGWARHLINQYQQASENLAEALDGLERIYGVAAFPPLKTKLFQGFVAERLGEAPLAIAKYQNILDLWVPIVGNENALALFAQAGLGSAYCKLGTLDLAEETLNFVWTIRRANQKVGINIGVDSGISLATVYRELGNRAKADGLLDTVSESPIFPGDFERQCQIQHVRALLEFDAGDYERPKRSLEQLLNLVTGDNRDLNNRELLLIRLDLADAFQQKDPSDEGLPLFEGLIEPVITEDNTALAHDFVTIHSLDDEPEPASQLRVAKEALKLVRAAKEAEAELFLADRHLRWVSKKDFWVKQGGPITDTAWMSGPRLLQVTKSQKIGCG